MALVRCKWCGRPFQSMGHPFCPNCIKELDEQYKPVRDFLYDYPNASIEQVVEETGVPERVILYYLKDGRLSMANASGLLRCEQCGARISSGRFCESCQAKIDQRIVQPAQARIAAKQREDELRRQQTFNTKSQMYTGKNR